MVEYWWGFVLVDYRLVQRPILFRRLVSSDRVTTGCRRRILHCSPVRRRRSVGTYS